MGGEFTKIYQNKLYVFEWGTKPCTFSQFVEGSKAAYCLEEDTYYWIYFDEEDKELSQPVDMIKMSADEREELDYIDILNDLADANHRGMYPEVTDEVRRVLVGRSVRREVIFALNLLDTSLVKRYKGIVYMVSRQALDLFEKKMELRVAIGTAINTYMENCK